MSARRTIQPGTIIHLFRFSDHRDSYENLLAATKLVVKTRDLSGPIIPEDLIDRHPSFYTTAEAGLFDGEIPVPKDMSIGDQITWHQVCEMVSGCSKDVLENKVLTQIRLFLFFAERCGDMKLVDRDGGPKQGFELF